MAKTYQLINSVTVGAGGSASIDFTSIPSTFADLIICGSVRFADIAGVSQAVSIKFNTLSTNQTWIQLYGTGSTSGTNGSAGLGQVANGNGTASTASMFSNFELYLPNYAGSNNKSVLTHSVVENNDAAATQIFSSTLWSSSSAITSISLIPNTAGNFAQYTTAYLYGIKNS